LHSVPPPAVASAKPAAGRRYDDDIKLDGGFYRTNVVENRQYA